MRGHKFIIITANLDHAYDCDFSSDVLEMLAGCELPELAVVTGCFEKFGDNVVTLPTGNMISDTEPETMSFFRAINGKLWKFEDWMDKNAAIAAFEQTDEE
jgi:hypothetical protein